MLTVHGGPGPLLSRSADQRDEDPPPRLEEKPTPSLHPPSASSGRRPSPWAELSLSPRLAGEAGPVDPRAGRVTAVGGRAAGCVRGRRCCWPVGVSGPPGRPSAPQGSQLPRAGGPIPALLSFLSMASLCWAKTLTLAGGVPPAPLSGLSSPEISRPRAELTLSKNVGVGVQSLLKACRQVGKIPT